MDSAEDIIENTFNINHVLTTLFSSIQSLSNEKNIELLVRDTTPNHLLKGLNLEHFDLPATEKMATEIVRLPTYPDTAVPYWHPNNAVTIGAGSSRLSLC